MLRFLRGVFTLLMIALFAVLVLPLVDIELGGIETAEIAYLGPVETANPGPAESPALFFEYGLSENSAFFVNFENESRNLGLVIAFNDGLASTVNHGLYKFQGANKNKYIYSVNPAPSVNFWQDIRQVSKGVRRVKFS